MSEEETVIHPTNLEDYHILQNKLLLLHLPKIITNTPAFQSFIPLIEEINATNGVEILRKLPIMTKHDILIEPEKYHRSDILERFYDVRTGGTSGEILQFSRIKPEYEVERKHIEYCWKSIGIKLGEDKGVVLTARPPKHSQDGISFIDGNKMMWLACKDKTKHHWRQIYDKIIEYEPKYLRGYGSLVSGFFKQLFNDELPMPSSIKSLVYSSDPILPSELKFIRENYCDNIISLYGQTERVCMGITCEEGDKFHLLPTYGFTEIIRDDGSVIEEPGEIGEIVATSLYNRYCSFVRYRTGDMGCWSDGKCACGRKTPSIDHFLQRSHEKIVTNLGEEVSMARRPSFLEMRESLPVGTGIQFLQRQPGHLHVFIETLDKNDNIFSTALNYLKTEFIVTHEFVDQPILGQNGKRTLFV